MLAILRCPHCGHATPFAFSHPYSEDDPHPLPEIVICGDDDHGCYHYFAATPDGQIFKLVAVR